MNYPIEVGKRYWIERFETPYDVEVLAVDFDSGRAVVRDSWRAVVRLGSMGDDIVSISQFIAPVTPKPPKLPMRERILTWWRGPEVKRSPFDLHFPLP